MVWRKNDNFSVLHASRHDSAAFQSPISHEHWGPEFAPRSKWPHGAQAYKAPNFMT